MLRSTIESWAWTNLGVEVCSTGRVPDRGVAVSIRRTQPVALSSPPILSALFSRFGTGIYICGVVSWTMRGVVARGGTHIPSSMGAAQGYRCALGLRSVTSVCCSAEAEDLGCVCTRVCPLVRCLPTSFFLPANTSNLTCLFLPSLRVIPCSS